MKERSVPRIDRWVVCVPRGRTQEFQIAGSLGHRNSAGRALACSVGSFRICEVMSFPAVSSRLGKILACPKCRAELLGTDESLQCDRCGTIFRVRNGVPLFLAEPIASAIDHTSNPIGPEFEALLQNGKDFILNLGAGGTAQRYPNCIELEHKIFRHTDVVGDAHHLPFRDSVFDRVFAFNVFEHLRDPRGAAAEIRRVLKPGGSVAIHTAFLQALHEAPHHFYNATEFGVREWFSGFDIEAVEVTGNFGPGVMLAFLMSNLLETMRQGGASWKDQMQLSGTTIGEWADFWAGQSDQPPGFQALQDLPQELQSRVAAGFELVARKPAAAT